MIDLKLKYQKARKEAIQFMKNGQISAYLNALVEMNKYKRLLTAIAAN